MECNCPKVVKVKRIPRAWGIKVLFHSWFKNDTWTILYLSFNLAIFIPLQIPHWVINLQSHVKWVELRWIPCGNTPQKVPIHPKSGLGVRSRGKYVSNSYSRLSDITPLTNYQRTNSCSCNSNGNGTNSSPSQNVVYLTSKDDLLYGYIKVECPICFGPSIYMLTSVEGICSGMHVWYLCLWFL